MRQTLPELASTSIRGLWERRQFTQQQLARRTARPQSVINRIIHGKQPVTLDVLEAVAELTQISAAELLADPTTQVRVLSPDEGELLTYFRTWPRATREALISFARFFAQEPPLEAQLRAAVEYLRGMGKGERDRAVAYLLMLHEGGLTRDLRIALGLPETDDGPPKRQRPPRTARPSGKA